MKMKKEIEPTAASAAASPTGPEALGGGEGVGGGPEDASHYHACLSSLTKDVRGFTKWWSTWPQEGQA